MVVNIAIGKLGGDKMLSIIFWAIMILFVIPFVVLGLANIIFTFSEEFCEYYSKSIKKFKVALASFATSFLAHLPKRQ